MSVVLSKKQQAQLQAVIAERGTGDINREETLAVSKKLFGKDNSLAWIAQNATKVSWGVYSVASLVSSAPVTAEPVAEQPAQNTSFDMSRGGVAKAKVNADAADAASVALTGNDDLDNGNVPLFDKNYVAHANIKVLEPIIKSQIFYPVFITGLSGNGKTTMVQQVCAKLKRELFRANITIETDEDDLLGGFRLLAGDTVWQDGPVITAMQRGAVLLLDEVDLASNKIMCLQSVLEGKSIFLKKTNRLIQPAKGFTVIATANTKGKGDNTGGFVGTNVLNEAFLDRFPSTLYQDFPTTAQEIKILTKIRESLGQTEEQVKDGFTEKLVTWAGAIRKSYEEHAIEEIVTTRRLINIVQAFAIFGDKMQAIKMCIERFDDETKASFMDFYSKLDETVSAPAAKGQEVKKEDIMTW